VVAQCWNNYPCSMRRCSVLLGLPNIRNQYDLQGNTFLGHRVTSDKMWMCYFPSDKKWSSMGWHHKGSPPLKKSEPRSSKLCLGLKKSNWWWFSSSWCNNQHTALQQLVSQQCAPNNSKVNLGYDWRSSLQDNACPFEAKITEGNNRQGNHKPYHLQP
jgi:hypothetical protein